MDEGCGPKDKNTIQSLLNLNPQNNFESVIQMAQKCMTNHLFSQSENCIQVQAQLSEL